MRARARNFERLEMNYFDHEKLDVYKAAIKFIVLVDEIIKHLPRGRSYLAEQLQRAGTSVPLNIAEGSGEYSGNEKVRFYRMAKRSATECAGILEICRELKLIEEALYLNGRELLIRIVAMLTKMAQTINLKSGTGTHAGTGTKMFEGNHGPYS
ncbi:MAG TPA: four helix bundle protein [Rhabdochlamydiaceae bacterium]|nr:four helix bundle protein [Rhabdochlamydiaceae bacterium]